MSWPKRHKICWKGLMLFGRLGILMAADIVNIFIHSWQYFYFQFWLTFMRPTMNKLLPMSLSVWGDVCVCVSVCDCVLRFRLNYGNMPKICFSLWGLPSNLFPFAFSLCLLLVYGFYRPSTLSLCCPLFWPIFRLLLLLLLSLRLRASNFQRAMKRLLCYI